MSAHDSASFCRDSSALRETRETVAGGSAGTRWGITDFASVDRHHVAAVALADDLERDLIERARRLSELVAWARGHA